MPRKQPTLIERAEALQALCDPECQGRCAACPQDVVRDLIAALRAVQEAPAIFVYVDLSPNKKDQICLIVFERRKGWALHALRVVKFHADDRRPAEHIAHEVAKLCSEHRCIPVIETIGFGELIMAHVLVLLGSKWPPEPFDYIPEKNRKVRDL